MKTNLYTIKMISNWTGTSYQNLWSRLKKNNILPVAPKKTVNDSGMYSLKQFAQILTAEEAEKLPEDVKKEFVLVLSTMEEKEKKSTVTDKENDTCKDCKDMESRISVLESRICEQDKLIEELKKEISDMNTRYSNNFSLILKLLPKKDKKKKKK